MFTKKSNCMYCNRSVDTEERTVTVAQIGELEVVGAVSIRCGSWLTRLTLIACRYVGLSSLSEGNVLPRT